MSMRNCPICLNTAVIEDGYCGHCRQITMANLVRLDAMMRLNIDKSKAMLLVHALARTSIEHFAIANGLKVGKLAKAADREFKAASALIHALGHETTEDEIHEALGW